MSLIKKLSKIHQVGIFTNQDIKKNGIIYEVPLNIILTKPKPKCAFIGNNQWVCDENVLNYINHSCDPNAVLDLSTKPKLVAKRDIKNDEEITVDYDKTERNGRQIKCSCQSKNCKKYFLRIE